MSINDPLHDLSEVLSDLSLSERGQDVQDSFKEAAHELLLRWQLKISSEGQDNFIRLREIEFASSQFGDKIQKHELQKTLGHFYVHRHPKSLNSPGLPSMVGFDITCGNEDFFGTILIRAIEYNGQLIQGPNKALRKICEISMIDFSKCILLDGLDLLDPASRIHFVPCTPSETHLSWEKRSSIADPSGALLRAIHPGTTASGTLTKSSVLSIPLEVQIAQNLAGRTEVPLTSKPRMIKRSKKGLSEIEAKARQRYLNLVSRSFEREFESYLYHCLFNQKIAHSLNDFLEFCFSDSEKIINLRKNLMMDMDLDYNSIELLRKKNIEFAIFIQKNPTVEGIFKKSYKSQFHEQLTLEAFTELFSKESKCFYCEMTLDEMLLLAKDGKIRTKRKYIKGKSLEIDKKDPSGEYEIKNIVMCCYWCNNAKTDEFSAEEFKPIAQAMRPIWKARLESQNFLLKPVVT